MSKLDIPKSYNTHVNAIFAAVSREWLDESSPAYIRNACNFNVGTFLEDEQCRRDAFYAILTSDLKPSTKKTYLHCLKRYTVLYSSEQDELVGLIDFVAAHARQEVEEDEKLNLVGYLENRRWYTWEVIVSWFKRLYESLYTETNCSDYVRWQQCICLGMYVLHPPLRLDYGNVKYIDIPTEENVTDDNFIYYDTTTKRYIVHISRDKVSTKRGPHQFVLHDVMVNLLYRASSRFPGRLFLLTHTKDIRLSIDSYKPRHGNKLPTEEKNKSSHRWLLESIHNDNGVASGLCVDTIRSAYYTYRVSNINMSWAEKEDLAAQMRSSVITMEKSYKKVQVYDDINKIN